MWRPYSGLCVILMRVYLHSVRFIVVSLTNGRFYVRTKMALTTRKTCLFCIFIRYKYTLTISLLYGGALPYRFTYVMNTYVTWDTVLCKFISYVRHTPRLEPCYIQVHVHTGWMTLYDLTCLTTASVYLYTHSHT